MYFKPTKLEVKVTTNVDWQQCCKLITLKIGPFHMMPGPEAIGRNFPSLPINFPRIFTILIFIDGKIKEERGQVSNGCNEIPPSEISPSERIREMS